MANYFKSNRNTLFVPCGPSRIFSHCQPYYLFIIDMKSRECSPFKRQPCMNWWCIWIRSRRFGSHRSDSRDSVLVIVHDSFWFSYNRLDRLKYHVERWKGAMSIACFVPLDEYKSFVKSISSYLGMPITFVVYVPSKPNRLSYFIEDTGVKRIFPSTLYPLNLLRDLAIESIHTTHYMHIDVDLFLSSLTSAFSSFLDTIEQSIRDNLITLLNERNVLLLLAFRYSFRKLASGCTNRGIGCKEL